MRIRQIGLRGISEAFRDRVAVDFEALGPGLIAIVGENGAGKSTLIGSVFAAFFRQLPGQKRALYDFCTHPEPEIDLNFSVNGGRYRSLLKLDPKARQMESYIFDAQGVALVSGKKEGFTDWVSKHLGSSSLFAASYFSSQKRTGNFLSLERSQRKELFITQLLGLERLRLISATAKGFGEQAARRTLAFEGEQKGLAQVLAGGSEVEDVEKLTRELEALGATAHGLDEKKNALEQQAQDLQGRESERKALESQRQELNRQIEKNKAEVAELRKQMADDDHLLAGREKSDAFAERERAVAEEIAALHREIAEAQQAEASNREVETALRTVETDLKTKREERKWSQVESGELASVPCRGEGPYAGCVKIQRALQARQQLPILEGELSTLELEPEIQRGALVAVPASSAQLMRKLQELERERQKMEMKRKRQEEMRIAEARPRGASRKRRKGASEQRCARNPAGGSQPALEQFPGLEAEVTAIRRQVEEIKVSLSQMRTERERVIARKAQAEQATRQTEAARARAAVLQGELGEARVERDDFNYLAKAFGADEIQLCEIQSAGPGITEMWSKLKWS